MSRVSSLLTTAVLTLAAAPALAGEAYTTRIEPRGFYGATISIEEGVRVFRPLPPVRHVIVNPGGATPLNLSISDVRVDERRTNYNYNQYDGIGDGSGYYSYGGGYFGGFGGHGKKSRGETRFGDPVGGHGHHGGGKGGGKH